MSADTFDIFVLRLIYVLIYLGLFAVALLVAAGACIFIYHTAKQVYSWLIPPRKRVVCCYECHTQLDKWDTEHNVVHRPDLRHYCLDCWLDVGMYLSDAERRTRIAEVKQAQAHIGPTSTVSESVPVDFEHHPPKALEWKDESVGQNK